ncbi:syntaxin binding protein 1 [Blastocladiella emersonii ATCC 22665]|nr:syntaxin binding protein 1 [Blastocladiella emersonii ATCC 22665]
MMQSAGPSGFSLKEATKRRLINDMVRFVQPANKWKVMVVDPISMKILNYSLKMFDILDENVTLVELITKKRQPYPNLEAIYFLSPTPEAIAHFIVDFCPGGGKKPLYAAAHLFFLGVLPDRLMDRITQSGAARYIKNLKELYVDYLPLESRVFSLDSPASFFRLFSPEAGGLPAQRAEMDVTAKRLKSLLVTLGDYPYIRYYRPVGDPDNNRSSKFAYMVSSELENHARVDPSFPTTDANSKGTLLVVDRSLDMNAPLLHEFTYQAMAYDLLPLEDGKYLYAVKGQDGAADSEKEIPLDDSDSLWVDLRHKHIADTIKSLLDGFNKFLSENKAASAAMGGAAKSSGLKDMKDMLAAMPQFQEMKQKYSVHINLSQECMNIFERRKLADTAAIEQNMATGETADGGKPKNLVSDMVPLLDDPALTVYDKVRLLMLFIISKEGVQDDDRRKLLEHANVGLELAESITNMALLGVKLSRDGKRDKAKKDKRKPAAKRPSGDEDDGAYELSRYVTQLKTALEDHISGSLETDVFPYLGPAPAADASARTGGTSLRSTKPSWQQKKSGGAGAGGDAAAAGPPKGGRLIVFVLGGMTYSEIRSVYEVAAAMNKEVIIGSTHIVTPTKFVDDLKNLRRPQAFAAYAPSFGFGEGPQPLPEPSEKERKKMQSAEARAEAGHAASPATAPAAAGDGKEKKKKKLFGLF